MAFKEEEKEDAGCVYAVRHVHLSHDASSFQALRVGTLFSIYRELYPTPSVPSIPSVTKF